MSAARRRRMEEAQVLTLPTPPAYSHRRRRCPIEGEAGRALADSRRLLAALRRLRASQRLLSRRLCSRCIENGRCQASDELSLLVQQAVQQVIEEWDRSSD